MNSPKRQLVRITYKFARKGSGQYRASSGITGWRPFLPSAYRVRSPRGTLFRQWATARLEEYLRKGFVMDDERLKTPPGPGVPDYFDELLERIRDIRASERRVYLRVREILALAADYAPEEKETQAVFQVVQNKLHFAATGKTAPELIAARADAGKANMGLTAWKGGVVRKGDVTVAKNYLREDEINELNRIVVMFLDFAEDQARRKKQIFLRDWKTRLDEFLRFNERAVLPGAGAVSREDADRKAAAELVALDCPVREMADVGGVIMNNARRHLRRRRASSPARSEGRGWR